MSEIALPPLEVHIDLRSRKETMVIDRGKVLECPECGEEVKRYLSVSEFEGSAWPEHVRFEDKAALAFHAAVAH